jgi:hypothetical protein
MEVSADTDFRPVPNSPDPVLDTATPRPLRASGFFGSGEFFGKPGEGSDMFIAPANITIYSHRAEESS